MTLRDKPVQTLLRQICTNLEAQLESEIRGASKIRGSEQCWQPYWKKQKFLQLQRAYLHGVAEMLGSPQALGPAALDYCADTIIKADESLAATRLERERCTQTETLINEAQNEVRNQTEVSKAEPEHPAGSASPSHPHLNGNGEAEA